MEVWANILAFGQNQQVSDVSFNTVGQYDKKPSRPQIDYPNKNVVVPVNDD